jgi:hypothetical protein
MIYRQAKGGDSMFTRAGRIAAAAFVVIVACAALARCGGGMRSPTEPAALTATPTPLPTPSPVPTPSSPTPTPAPMNSAVFGYVSTISDVTQHYLSRVVLRLHQDGAADQVENSSSLDGSYSFCCLRAGSAVITATLAGFHTFRATITVGQIPVRYDIQMTPSSVVPAPTGVAVPIE